MRPFPSPGWGAASRIHRPSPVTSSKRPMSTKRNARTTVGCEETYPGWDYTDDELEFLMAMDRFRRDNRRRFPTCRDTLRVLLSLGYRKQPGLVPSPDGIVPSPLVGEG